MKTKLLFSSLFVAALALTACKGGKSSSEAAVSSDAPEEVDYSTLVSEYDGAAVTVTDILANPDTLVGQPVAVEGTVNHLCAHGGKKAFILNPEAPEQLLRCQATDEMGGSFPKTTVGKSITVKGILMENRTDEEAIQKMEEAHAAQVAAQQEAGKEMTDEDKVGGCETERKVDGTASANTFEDRMAALRAKIAEREAAEGKNYLSEYYIVTYSYEVAE